MPLAHTLSHAFRNAACVAALVLITSVGASAQYAHLTLQSQPGDYIGLGKNYDILYTASDAQQGIFSAIVLRPTEGKPPDYVRFTFAKSDSTFVPMNFAFLDFSTSGLGIALTPGVYNDARRASSTLAVAGHPGLDVNFESRASNTVTGNFTVTDFAYTMTAPNVYVIDSFAASFEQHSEGAVPALFGQLTYNANGDAPVPEASTPVSFGLLLALGLGGAVIAARKKKVAV